MSDDEGAVVVVPATRMYLADEVVERLAASIGSGAWVAGTRLPSERGFAEQLGVSRIVVREALRSLAERGLVEVRPGVGTFVAALDAAVAVRPLSRYIRHRHVDAEHLFEVRRSLEPDIAAHAAARADPAAHEALRANLQRTAGIVARLEGMQELTEAFAWVDLEFHQVLAAATGNPLFEMLLNPMLDNLLDLRRAGTRVPGAAKRAYEDHRRICDHVIVGDAAGARRSMRDHLNTVEGWIVTATSAGLVNDGEPTRHDATAEAEAPEGGPT